MGVDLGVYAYSNGGKLVTGLRLKDKFTILILISIKILLPPNFLAQIRHTRAQKLAASSSTRQQIKNF